MRRLRAKLAFACALLGAWTAINAPAQTSSTASPQVQYSISLARAAAHLALVTIRLSPGPAVRELQLPVWNALYEVRDFAQYVDWVKASAADSHRLSLRKLDKSRWQVSGMEAGGTITYEIFVDQPGPYSAQINAHHAFLNLADILMYPLEARSTKMNLRFADVPSGWRIATALKPDAVGYTADNYDQLVDSPCELGAFQEQDFDQGGGRYRIVVDADSGDYDLQKIVHMANAIVAAATVWMNDRPFQDYLFIYHFPREAGGGGMEHAFSTAIDLNAGVLRANPQALADVTAHEFFHLWNVKRIRPQSLEPVDYSKENYTTALWFSEGFTSTVGDYTLLRAGLLDESRYLSRLAEQITTLERRPAHLTQSAEESSLDTWLEKYSYYRLPQRSISYYNKGQLLGVLLDLEMRDASHGKATLRDLFQWMNLNLAQRGVFFADSAGVRAPAEQLCGCDLADFFSHYVAGTEELPYDRLFATVGLRLKKDSIVSGAPGFAATRGFGEAPVVTSLDGEGPAVRAGLALGDAILTIDGQPAGPDFEDRLDALRPDETVRLRVRGPGGEREVRWKVGSKEELEFELKDVENITPQQKARRAAWLGGVSQGEARP